MKKLIIIFLFITSVLQAQTTYHVSSGEALNTIAEVNALNLQPGDSVLFNRGETWVTSGYPLSIVHSGEAGNPIVYGAYGTGARPIITGRQSVSGWNTAGNWTNTSGSIWRMTTTIRSTRLWLSDVESMKCSNATVTSLLPWFYDATYLYVYSATNPATAFTNIESLYTDAMITAEEGVDYVTFQNINFQGWFWTGFHLTSISNWVIENCDIGMYCSSTGILLVTSDNIIVRNCTFDTGDNNMDAYEAYNSYEGIAIEHGNSEVQVYSNAFSNWSHASVATLRHFGDPAITNIKIHHNTMTAGDIDYGRAYVHNDLGLNPGDCTGIEFFSNYIYNTKTRNQINGDGIKFYNNIIDGVFPSSHHPGTSEGLNMQAYSGIVTNNEIYNNIIMNCHDGGITIPYATNLNENNLYKNNILINNDDANGYQLIYYWAPDATLQNTFQNNLMYKSGVTDLIFYEKMANAGVIPMTIAEFNAMNGITTGMRDGEVADVITNNIGGDPLFVDATNANYLLRDYHLSEGSPAIGAGIAVGLTYDYDSVLYLATPSIGALEYGSAPEDPDPPDLPTVSTNPVTSLKSISATFSGTSTGTSITDRGFAWGTSINPSVSGTHVHIGTGEGTFTYWVNNLLSGTTYHVRSFATNSEGTVYGADISFTTPAYTLLKDTKIYKVGSLIMVID